MRKRRLPPAMSFREPLNGSLVEAGKRILRLGGQDETAEAVHRGDAARRDGTRQPLGGGQGPQGRPGRRRIPFRSIGTPATRADVIEKLIRTGYVDRKGKQLRSTEQADP